MVGNYAAGTKVNVSVLLSSISSGGSNVVTYEFTGDVSLEYGGSFIDLSTWDDGYCTAVRVTDLDSGCGFTGAVLIEHVVINGTNDSKRIRNSLRSCGNPICRGMTKQAIRHMVAESLLSYGYYDPDDSWDNYTSDWKEVVQCEPDGPHKFDGWKADTILDPDVTLEEYVQSNHLR